MPKGRGDSTSSADQALSQAELEQIVQKALAAAMDVFRAELGQRLSDVESRVQSLETGYNDIENRLNAKLAALKTKADDIESTLEKVETDVFNSATPEDGRLAIKDVVTTKQLDAVKKQALDVALHANDNEQYSRRNNLRIRGLPTVSKNDDCRIAVHRFLHDQLHSDITVDDIDVAHPVPVRQSSTGSTSTSPPTILVRFKSHAQRDWVIRRRRSLKGTAVSIQEDLTSLNVKTMNRFSRNDQVANVWSWSGKLLVQLKTGSILQVRPFQTLNENTPVDE